MRAAVSVPRRRGLSYEEFLEVYGRPGQPVVVEDLTDDWPARRWTPEFFEQRYGSLRVTVSKAARKTELPVRMSMGEYVRYMRDGAARDERPWYLSSWDFTVECPELRGDFTLPRYFAEDYIVRLPEEIRPRLLWIFMGPPGSGFRLHVDVGMTAAWNAQLMGTKEWVLFAPEDGENVYSGRVDAFAPDLSRFPRLAQAQPYTTTLGPGDVIFTPSRWWHQTRILEPSVSVTGNYCNDTNLAVVLEWLGQQADTAELARALEAVSSASVES